MVRLLITLFFLALCLSALVLADDDQATIVYFGDIQAVGGGVFSYDSGSQSPPSTPVGQEQGGGGGSEPLTILPSTTLTPITGGAVYEYLSEPYRFISLLLIIFLIVMIFIFARRLKRLERKKQAEAADE